MKKGWKAAAVSVLLTASLAGQAFAVSASDFKDIDHIGGKEKIIAMQEKGIVKGMTLEAFMPESSLTAAQGLSLIVRAMELEQGVTTLDEITLTNVKENAWYEQDLKTAYANGLEFPVDLDPSQALTKEEFVHYLVQGFELTGNYPMIKMFIQIEDEADIQPEYQGTIQRSLLYRIVSLDDAGNFDPKHVLTRSEAVAMLYDAYEFVQSHQDKETASE